MQNQPGSQPRKSDLSNLQRDRQAASLREDMFRGGQPSTLPFRLSWLRSPWKPAVSRLFRDRREPGE